jgi:sortase A
VLQVGAGHVVGTSLPTGGAGTHCAISGHSGLPSAMLFTNLDQLVMGDEFSLHVLNETLTYRVDQIQVVEPYDLTALEIDPDQDYCTLVTCTPYGINSHRLMVRGVRTQTEQAVTTTEPVQTEVVQTSPYSYAPAVSHDIIFANSDSIAAAMGEEDAPKEAYAKQILSAYWIKWKLFRGKGYVE